MSPRNKGSDDLDEINVVHLPVLAGRDGGVGEATGEEGAPVGPRVAVLLGDLDELDVDALEGLAGVAVLHLQAPVHRLPRHEHRLGQAQLPVLEPRFPLTVNAGKGGRGRTREPRTQQQPESEAVEAAAAGLRRSGGMEGGGGPRTVKGVLVTKRRSFLAVSRWVRVARVK